MSLEGADTPRISASTSRNSLRNNCMRTGDTDDQATTTLTCCSGCMRVDTSCSTSDVIHAVCQPYSLQPRTQLSGMHAHQRDGTAQAGLYLTAHDRRSTAPASHTTELCLWLCSASGVVFRILSVHISHRFEPRALAT